MTAERARCFLGTITHIKDGETNKQTIIPTAGAAFPLSKAMQNKPNEAI